VTVVSSQSNLENCKLDIVNATNTSQILATGTSFTNSSYCQIIIFYTTTKNQNLFGRLYIDTTNSTGFLLVNADVKWILFDLNNTKGWTTITSFFTDLKSLSEFGTGNEAEFNRIVFFFLITTMLIGVFIYFSGIEMSNPGLALIIIWTLVLISSISGFLTYNVGATATTHPVATIFGQYGFFFIFTLFNAGYWLSLLRRTGE
jgi:hypothetical protein